jgi:hypothetical protein
VKRGSLLLRDLREYPETEARDLLVEYTRYVQREILERAMRGVQTNCTCLADQCRKLLGERPQP